MCMLCGLLQRFIGEQRFRLLLAGVDLRQLLSLLLVIDGGGGGTLAGVGSGDLVVLPCVALEELAHGRSFP